MSTLFALCVLRFDCSFVFYFKSLKGHKRHILLSTWGLIRVISHLHRLAYWHVLHLLQYSQFFGRPSVVSTRIDRLANNPSLLYILFFSRLEVMYLRNVFECILFILNLEMFRQLLRLTFFCTGMFAFRRHFMRNGKMQLEG